MGIHLHEELRRAVDASPQPPHDRGGDLPRGKARLRRRRAVTVAGVVPLVAAVVLGASALPRALDRSSDPVAPASTPSPASPSSGPHKPPLLGPVTPSTRTSGWHATTAAVGRAASAGLGCRIVAGEEVWVCNGTTRGKAAVAYWDEGARSLHFGDPAHGDHEYLYADGTTEPAYPSQVWSAIGRSLVGTRTSARITTWLQQHETGSVVIDGVLVEIDGPIAAVSGTGH